MHRIDSLENTQKQLEAQCIDLRQKFDARNELAEMNAANVVQLELKAAK